MLLTGLQHWANQDNRLVTVRKYRFNYFQCSSKLGSSAPLLVRDQFQSWTVIIHCIASSNSGRRRHVFQGESTQLRRPKSYIYIFSHPSESFSSLKLPLVEYDRMVIVVRLFLNRRRSEVIDVGTRGESERSSVDTEEADCSHRDSKSVECTCLTSLEDPRTTISTTRSAPFHSSIERM